MGDYVSATDVSQLMPQLPQTSGAEGYTATNDIITLAIRRSESKVNSFLGVKYTLPFTAVPIQVRDEALQLAVYYTYQLHYPKDNITSNNFIEAFDASPNNAFEQLKAIRDGQMRIQLTNGTEVAFKSSALGVRATHATYQPVHDMDSVTASKVDQNLLDTISDARE